MLDDLLLLKSFQANLLLVALKVLNYPALECTTGYYLPILTINQLYEVC